jgi:hypothetical protein
MQSASTSPDASRPSIAELKLAIAKVSGTPVVESAAPPLTTGWREVDRLLGGGLPRGRTSEASGARSSGKASLALAATASATTAGQLVAWIDGAGELWPPAAAAAGVDLARLLLVRLPGAPAVDLARAGEIAARSRAFPLVVVDLPAGVLTERAANRLRAAAHEAGVAVLVLTGRRGALPQAHCQLELAAQPGAWASTGDAGQRRFAVTLHKGGVAPGERAVVACGQPERARYRDEAAQLELAAVAEAITPVRVPRRRSSEVAS